MNLQWLKFDMGNAKDITIYTTDEYFKVYENGNTDPEMINDMIQEGLDKKTIFDVGAFIGLSSMVFSKYSKNCKIVSFEPNPYNRERISKNFERNKNFSKNILIYPYALSNENGKTNMFLSKIIEGPSSTSRINGSHSTIANEDLPNVFENCEVETKTLDSFVVETKLIPDMIKIDIEGAEFMCLLGALNTIEKYHPLLYIELHSEYCAYKCTELLTNLGYKINLLKEERDNRIIIKAKFYKEITNIDNIRNYENLAIEICGKLDLYNQNIDTIKNILKNKHQEEIVEKTTENDELKNELKLLKEKNEQLNIDNKNIELKVSQLKSDNNIMKTKISELEKYIEKIIQSKSWKLTEPVRRLRLIGKKKTKYEKEN